MKERKLSQEWLAEQIGVSQGAVAHWLNGRREPSLDTISRVLQVLGLPPIGVKLPEREPVGVKLPSPEPNAEMIGAMSPWDSSTPLGDDEVAVPLYKEVELAAGAGSTHAVERTDRLLRFAKSTLREAGVSPKNAACATVYGRSMERLIMDGATVGIDMGTTNIHDGEIYAIDHDGMLRVKYLYRLPGGGLRIRSENAEEYPDETLTAEEAATVRVLGWVFWWSTVRQRPKGVRGV